MSFAIGFKSSQLLLRTNGELSDSPANSFSGVHIERMPITTTSKPALSLHAGLADSPHLDLETLRMTVTARSVFPTIYHCACAHAVTAAL